VTINFSIRSSSGVFWPRSSQIGYRRSTGFALVEPRAFMFERSVISHKKPVGLPGSTAPDKNIRMFVPQNFEHFLPIFCLWFRQIPILERIPVTWKRSLHVGSNWYILAG
jgi:hypothetical protein